MKKTHFRRADYRIESLKITIQYLERSIEEIRLKEKQLEWYDGIWLLEESEPILGLAFIAFQNYINSSINDRFETIKGRVEKYKLGDKVTDSTRSEIELIIGLANYYKHRDSDKKLFNETAEVLDDLGFNYGDSFDLTNSPLFIGTELLSKNQRLFEILEKVKAWRETLWTKT